MNLINPKLPLSTKLGLEYFNRRKKEEFEKMCIGDDWMYDVKKLNKIKEENQNAEN